MKSGTILPDWKLVTFFISGNWRVGKLNSDCSTVDCRKGPSRNLLIGGLRIIFISVCIQGWVKLIGSWCHFDLDTSAREMCRAKPTIEHGFHGFCQGIWYSLPPSIPLSIPTPLPPSPLSLALFLPPPSPHLDYVKLGVGLMGEPMLRMMFRVKCRVRICCGFPVIGTVGPALF